MKDWKFPKLTGSENMKERQESKYRRPTLEVRRKVVPKLAHNRQIRGVGAPTYPVAQACAIYVTAPCFSVLAIFKGFIPQQHSFMKP